MAGRPRFKPTAKQRERVKLLKADGWSNDRIAAQIGVSRNTLEAALAAELEFGADAKRMEVLENLAVASKKGNASASRLLIDRFDVASTLRREHPVTEERAAPKEKLGKKVAAELAAQQPDDSTEMGGLMKRRMEKTRTLN